MEQRSLLPRQLYLTGHIFQECSWRFTGETGRGHVCALVTNCSSADPFIFKDGSLQTRFHWSPEGVHADDFTYATVTKAEPREGDAMVVFEPDVWSPGLVGFEWSQAWSLDWIRQIKNDGVARDAM